MCNITLDLLALNPYEFQHSQLVTLWKLVILAMKVILSLSCQINKVGLNLRIKKIARWRCHTEVSKRNIKKLNYWCMPRGVGEVKIYSRTPLTIVWWCGAQILSSIWVRFKKPWESIDFWCFFFKFWQFFEVSSNFGQSYTQQIYL